MTWLESNYPDSSIDDWDQATIAEADTYHAARGNTDWGAGSDPNKTIALQRSWDYLRGLSWKGDVFDTELPGDVKSAQIVGALAELTNPGSLQPETTREDYLVKKNIANVIIKEYSSGAPSSTKYKEMTSLLSKYLLGGGGNISVVRG